MIEQILQLRKRYQTMVKRFRQEDFKEYFDEFFKLYPFIQKIEWVQYAPYFNDGDPCEFSVHEPEVEIAASYLAKHPELAVTSSDFFDEDDEDDAPHVLSQYEFKKEGHKTNPQLAEAMKSIQDLFEAEDILKHVFGEHTKVKITQEQIAYETYDHD